MLLLLCNLHVTRLTHGSTMAWLDTASIIRFRVSSGLSFMNPHTHTYPTLSLFLSITPALLICLSLCICTWRLRSDVSETAVTAYDRCERSSYQEIHQRCHITHNSTLNQNQNTLPDFSRSKWNNLIILVLLLGLEFLTVRIYPSRNNCWLQKNILTL